MEPLIRHIHSRLIEKAMTIAVAESSSGGLLAKTLTDISGSSNYFILGIVAYSNSAKESVLKIPPGILRLKGAVSKETARRMAAGARKLAKADIGIGITGIAGPAGGTAEKPVGTVFIAIDAKTKNFSRRFCFRGRRSTVRKKTVAKALELLKRIV